MLDRLRGAAVAAYKAWAAWAAASLSAELRVLLLSDELLTCNTTPLSWQVRGFGGWVVGWLVGWEVGWMGVGVLGLGWWGSWREAWGVF